MTILNYSYTGHYLPGHVTGVTHPAILLLVIVAAGLADVELAVQALMLVVKQEFKRLETSNAMRLSQAGLVPQQLFLGIFPLNLGL